MFTLDELDVMSKMSIADVRKEDLQPMTERTVNPELDVDQRVLDFLKRVKNPYFFEHSGMTFKVEFTSGGPSLHDALQSLLIRLKTC